MPNTKNAVSPRHMVRPKSKLPSSRLGMSSFRLFTNGWRPPEMSLDTAAVKGLQETMIQVTREGCTKQHPRDPPFTRPQIGLKHLYFTVIEATWTQGDLRTSRFDVSWWRCTLWPFGRAQSIYRFIAIHTWPSSIPMYSISDRPLVHLQLWFICRVQPAAQMSNGWP